MTPLVEFRQAALGYHGRPVLKGVDLAVQSGSFWGVFGYNGSGKTTVLKTMLGLIPCVAGKLLLRGGHGGTPRFGYVPQKERLDPIYPLTALQVAALGTYRRLDAPVGRRARAGVEAARRCLKDCGALDLALKPYGDLSGGQKQRVLIARALAAEPEILALDEPLSGIDVNTQEAILDLLRGLKKSRDLTVLMISHRLQAEKELFTHMAWVDAGKVETGTAAEMLAGRVGKAFRAELSR